MDFSLLEEERARVATENETLVDFLYGKIRRHSVELDATSPIVRETVLNDDGYETVNELWNKLALVDTRLARENPIAAELVDLYERVRLVQALIKAVMDQTEKIKSTSLALSRPISP